MCVKVNVRSRGLGDTIAKVTRVTGIEKAVKVVTQAVGVKDCGCSQRQETLNRVFPYNNK